MQKKAAASIGQPMLSFSWGGLTLSRFLLDLLRVSSKLLVSARAFLTSDLAVKCFPHFHQGILIVLHLPNTPGTLVEEPA